MALVALHYFSYNSGSYFIRWDDVADTFDVIDLSNDSIVVLPNLTGAQLGKAAGDRYTSLCRGNDLYTILAILSHPFARMSISVNSPSCMPGALCDLQLVSIDKTDEVYQGLHGGTIQINATSSDFLRYSLDGVHWQIDNFFSNLAPGTYYCYVKTSYDGCQRYGLVTIADSAIVYEPDYPSLSKPCHFFKLTTPIVDAGTIIYNIEEPGKWDNVNFVGKRDKEWHGYRGMWSDGIIELEFDCAAGKEAIETAYNFFGSDVEILFEYGYSYQGFDFVLFPGKLNMNTAKVYPHKITASVEKADFNQNLVNRFDTKVSMAETKGYDGAVITPPEIIETLLHSKELARNTKIENSDIVIADQAQVGGYDFYIQPDTLKVTVGEIQEMENYRLGVLVDDPVVAFQHNFNIKFAGTYDFTIAYRIEVTFNKPFIPSTAYTLKNYFQINGVQTQIGATISGNIGVGITLTEVIDVNYSQLGKVLLPNDKVYIYSILHINIVGGLGITLKQTNLSIIVNSLEATNATACKAWLLYDAINHCTKVVTNGDGVVKSNFLSTRGAQQNVDGPGSLHLTTNGKQIRRFDVSKSPLVVSLKEILTSVKNIFCLGYNIERSGNKDVVRIERVEYFYQNNEILVIDDCFDYYEEVAKDRLYNEIEIGYDKYQDSGFNTLDEFNTKHEYLTPIKSNKLKLTAKSSLITSGYSIEDSRRQQYNLTPTDSYQNDDNAFLISVRRFNEFYVPEKDEAFATVNNLISPTTAYNLRLSPLRMLLNWDTWLKGSLFFKKGTDVIKKTEVAQNGLLQTQLLTGDDRAIGDINKLLWQEEQDILLQNYDVAEKIYKPEYIFFKCRLTPDKIQGIDKAMNGRGEPTKNYGYILVADGDGLYQAGWLEEIEYNYATERATFKLSKKWDSPLQPDAGCCKHLVVNGCFLKVNNNKIYL